MNAHTEAIVAKMTPLVSDPDTSVQGNAIGVLGRIGPPAKPALPELIKIMLDDQNHYAPSVARSIATIDPNEDIGPRLIELVERKHPNWYSAAFVLHQHVPADEARWVISKRYEAAENDSERNMAVQALNEIGVERDPVRGRILPP